MLLDFAYRWEPGENKIDPDPGFENLAVEKKLGIYRKECDGCYGIL